jgi:hypothetical protein
MKYLSNAIKFIEEPSNEGDMKTVKAHLSIGAAYKETPDFPVSGDIKQYLLHIIHRRIYGEIEDLFQEFYFPLRRHEELRTLIEGINRCLAPWTVEDIEGRGKG